jgi:hypothetical protein
MVSRSAWTREWWDKQRTNYKLVTSYLVLAELEAGNHHYKAEKIELLRQNASMLVAPPEIADIVRAYIGGLVMPRDPIADATHLAIASFHGCDILLTWNCAHLANPRKFRHIEKINGELGLSVPIIATPLQLLDEDLDES